MNILDETDLQLFAKKSLNEQKAFLFILRRFLLLKELKSRHVRSLKMIKKG